MSVTYGFYNSLNHDRVYDAKDFSEIFNGIINDGVFQSVGTAFVVTAGTGRTVRIGIGRAWLNGTWTHNDAILNYEMPVADVAFPRIDCLALEVNETSRENKFVVIQGEAKTVPVKPLLTKTTYVHQYPLCYITRKVNNDTIVGSEIESRIGTTDLPFVTGILKTIDLNTLLGQWQSELDEFVDRNESNISDWFENKKTEFENWSSLQENQQEEWIQQKQNEFDTWFASIKNIFDEGTITNLQTQIDDNFDFAMESATNTITFKPDGSVEENRDKYKTVTSFLSDGSIIQTITRKKDEANKTVTTKFNSDGTISVTSTAFAT